MIEHNIYIFYYMIESLGDGDNTLKLFTTREKHKAYVDSLEEHDMYEYIAGQGEITLPPETVELFKTNSSESDYVTKLDSAPYVGRFSLVIDSAQICAKLFS